MECCLKYVPVSVADGVGVFDPNMENVFEAIPLRLFFMKLAVACDDDENNDDVPVELVVVMVAPLAVTTVVAMAPIPAPGFVTLVMLGLLANGVAISELVNGVVYGVDNGVKSVNIDGSAIDDFNKFGLSLP